MTSPVAAPGDTTGCLLTCALEIFLLTDLLKIT